MTEADAWAPSWETPWVLTPLSLGFDVWALLTGFPLLPQDFHPFSAPTLWGGTAHHKHSFSGPQPQR